MQIRDNGRAFEVKFRFNPEIVSAIKTIEGSYWNKDERAWMVPKRSQAALNRFLQVYGDAMDEESVIHTPQMIFETPPMPELNVELPLRLDPYPYQKTGIAYNIEKRRTIIGDVMGLGKTLQAIASVVGTNAYPCLVVCPATLKLNWQKEWYDVAGKRAMILNDRVRNTWQQYHKVGMVDVFIVNYESLKKFFVSSGWKKKDQKQFKLDTIPFLDSIALFKSVIVDESHRCKNGDAQSTKFVMGIARGKENIFLLSGTPLINKPDDLIPQLHIIDRLKEVVSHIPHPINERGQRYDASGVKRFRDRYCQSKEGSNLEELHSRLRLFCYYRREKHEVLPDLPSKTRQVMLCEISNRKEYEDRVVCFKQYLKDIKAANNGKLTPQAYGQILNQIMVLGRICAKGKMESVREYVQEIIDSGEKIIVFCHFKEIAADLVQLFPNALTITGDDSNQSRFNAVNKFQNDPKYQVIICTLQAGGVGITLTASSRVAFIEFPWTFALCEQAEDRAHRIGQKDSVQATYFLAEDTVDRHRYDIIQRKKNIAQTVTGADDQVEEQIIDQILNLFNQS